MRRSSGNRSLRWLGVAAVLVAAATLLYLYVLYRQEAAAQQRALAERSEAFVNALLAGLRAHGRMGRYRTERLGIILEETAANPGVVGLKLETAGGALLASGGDVARVPAIAPGSHAWRGSFFSVATAGERLAPDWGGPPPGRGRGRAQMLDDASDGPPLPDGPYVLTATFDASDILAQLARDRARFAVSSVVVVAAVCLGGVTLALWVTRRALEAELAVALEQASHHQRLAQLGAGLAHETKNPLGVVRAAAQEMENLPGLEPRIRQLASSIVDEADRTVGRINGFLALARPREPHPETVDLDQLLADLLPLVEADAAAAGVHVRQDPNSMRVLADADLLRRALLNLLLNALRASPRGATVSIAGRREGGAVTVAVTDTGAGIAADDLPRVTTPYFSRFEGGTGLGLAIVDDIARAHGWTLHIASESGRGTEVSLEGLREVR